MVKYRLRRKILSTREGGGVREVYVNFKSKRPKWLPPGLLLQRNNGKVVEQRRLRVRRGRGVVYLRPGRFPEHPWK